MKKLGLLLAAAVLTLAACNSDSSQQKEEQQQTDTTTEEANAVNAKEDAHDHAHEDGEPDEHTKCAFCDMKVYMKHEEMGAFTAKAITADGETLFFDDAGCLLNYERDNEDVELKEKYVRDYNSLDWVALEQAKMVEANIQTPMKYGNAFFADTKSLESFMKDYPEAKQTTLEAIDGVAHDRYMKKMEMSGDGHDDHSEEGHDSHDGH